MPRTKKYKKKTNLFRPLGWLMRTCPDLFSTASFFVLEEMKRYVVSLCSSFCTDLLLALVAFFILQLRLPVIVSPVARHFGQQRPHSHFGACVVFLLPNDEILP